MIQIRDLKKQFCSHNPRKGFFFHIEALDIEEGEIVYVLGPNGSGKTTLLALIQGAINADAGSVRVSNSSTALFDLMELEPYKRSRYLGVVPQDSDESLVNEMTIADHVLVGFSRTNSVPLLFPRWRSRTSLKETLGRFDLGFEKRLNEYVGNLSGGERQVLTFCMATVVLPAIMLLDEFTSSLDPEMASKVSATVMAFLRSNKVTALIVTHRHKEALDNADRIIILHQGMPHCELKKGEEGFTGERVRAVFRGLYSNEVSSTFSE